MHCTRYACYHMPDKNNGNSKILRCKGSNLWVGKCQPWLRMEGLCQTKSIPFLLAKGPLCTLPQRSGGGVTCGWTNSGRANPLWVETNEGRECTPTYNFAGSVEKGSSHPLNNIFSYMFRWLRFATDANGCLSFCVGGSPLSISSCGRGSASGHPCDQRKC